jgi:hypothetical protein
MAINGATGNHVEADDMIVTCLDRPSPPGPEPHHPGAFHVPLLIGDSPNV